jgi:hypothetical protein
VTARRLLDADPLTGLATWHEHDPASGRTLIHYTQDVEPLIEANRKAANDAAGSIGDIVHVAAIPASVQLKWLIEKGVDVLDPDHRQRVARLLDDPEWRYLKTRNIILGRV